MAISFSGIKEPEQIIALWPKLSPLIRRAINAYHEHSLDDIFNSLLTKKRQIWVLGEDDIEAILTTTIFNKHDEKICFMELCGGRGIEFKNFIHIIEQWAKEAGCSRIKTSGRLGWARVLKDYKTTEIILEKEL